MSRPGLLLVRSKPQKVVEDEFNRWYNEEHVPTRTALPGWLTARRYVSTSDPTDFMACYDLADLSVLSDPTYVKARERRSPRERRVMASLHYLDRRVYRPVVPRRAGGNRKAGDLRRCEPFLLCVWWEPAADSVAAFHQWYEDEHIPMLAEIPGWERSRRFQLVAGDGPGYLAMHDLTSDDVFSHPVYQQATTTKMRDAVVADCVTRQKTLYRLLHNFDPSLERVAVI